MKGRFVFILHYRFLDLIFTLSADPSYEIHLHSKAQLFSRTLPDITHLNEQYYKIIQGGLFKSFFKQSFGLKQRSILPSNTRLHEMSLCMFQLNFLYRSKYSPH